MFNMSLKKTKKKNSINDAKIKINRKFKHTTVSRFYEGDPSLVPNMKKFSEFHSAR